MTRTDAGSPSPPPLVIRYRNHEGKVGYVVVYALNDAGREVLA